MRLLVGIAIGMPLGVIVVILLGLWHERRGFNRWWGP